MRGGVLKHFYMTIRYLGWRKKKNVIRLVPAIRGECPEIVGMFVPFELITKYISHRSQIFCGRQIEALEGSGNDMQIIGNYGNC